MYRPQFFFPTPKGYRDESFVRPVTVGQDPSGTIPAGQYINDYAIRMDTDAPQIIRSLFIEGKQQNQNSNIQMRLRDAFGNFLTDGYVPLWLYGSGAGSTPPDGGSGRTKLFESEIYCPPGSVLLADFFAPGGAATIPIFAGPSRMSVIHSAIQTEEHAVGGQGQGANVISFGGALYQVLQFAGLPFPAGIGSVNVYKSVNGGLTWTIQDGANSPTRNATFPIEIAGSFYDGAHTLTVASTLGSTTSSVASPIFLQDFNLLTGTWGAPYGTVGARMAVFLLLRWIPFRLAT